MVRTIVKIENLVKRYGSLVALDHLNLEVKEGEILGLLGPNGSGKTTALNCLLALLKYDKGTITVFDKEMHPTSYALKREIGVVPQNIAVFEKMTVQENIDYFFGSIFRYSVSPANVSASSVRALRLCLSVTYSPQK